MFLKQGRKCAISGNDIDFGFSGSKKRVKFSASLDRIDSSKGYTIDNVQWVHKDINWMKQDFEEKYFIQLCKNIANYQRKTWLITGALGYVGFEVCRLLKNSTDKVIAIDIIKVEERERQLNDWGIEFVRCDLFSLNMPNNIDYCIHCAGITDVPMTLSQSTPEKDREIIRVGTEGTRELIRFLPKQCKLAFLSTHVVYEGCINKTININETTEPEPILAYSRSKRQSELDLLNSCRDFLILRLGSVYGLPATRWKIVANLFSKMAAKEKKIKIFGGECLKPLVGIKDVAKAITGLIRSNYNREIFHIVNENVKIKDIATICKKYQNDLVIENVDFKSPNNGYSLSNEKFLATGFRFEQSLDIEISKMIHAWRNDLIN